MKVKLLIPQQKVQSIPKVDELVISPELAQDLPPDVAQKLYWQCLTVLTALAVPLAFNGHQYGVSKNPTDVLLDAEQVAPMINRSVSWVEKHVKDMPKRVSLLGLPLWRKSDIDRWIKALPEYGRPT